LAARVAGWSSSSCYEKEVGGSETEQKKGAFTQFPQKHLKGIIGRNEKNEGVGPPSAGSGRRANHFDYTGKVTTDVTWVKRSPGKHSPKAVRFQNLVEGGEVSRLERLTTRVEEVVRGGGGGTLKGVWNRPRKGKRDARCIAVLNRRDACERGPKKGD